MALRWCLAERLMPMYGKASPVQIQMINAYAAQSKATIKRNNMSPLQVARYPDSLLVGRAKDAGFIVLGKIDLISSGYEYQYLYVLQKPE
jgi:hypothetical protein